MRVQPLEGDPEPDRGAEPPAYLGPAKKVSKKAGKAASPNTPSAREGATGKAAAQRTVAKKAVAKKAVAKKAVAKKAVAKKTPTGKAPAKSAGRAAASRRQWVEPSDGACPTTHPVKAKLSSRLFHLPGMAAYARTQPDRCYRDESAAEDDGLTRARR